MWKTALWIILLSNLSTNSAIADTSFDKAIQLYNQKDFKAALATLEPLVRGEKKRDAIARYYLANTYSQLGRHADALAEYRASYAIDSKGESSVLCLQAIAHLTEAQSHNTARTPASVTAEAQTPPPAIDDHEVVSKLPRLPKYNAPPVTLAQVQKWSDRQRATYTTEAESNVPRVTEDARNAQTLLSSAESVVASLVPNSKAYGESEAGLQERRKAAEYRVSQLLAPFRQYSSNCQNDLEQSKAILEACQTSARGYNGWMPVGR